MSKILTDEQFLKEINTKLINAKSNVESILDKFADVELGLNDYYEGLAKPEIVPLVVDKYKQHLYLLEGCYEMMMRAINTTNEEMMEADQSAASQIVEG